MPKRTDIKTILVLGSGPIVIGQGCEFDYSGTQACKALKALGYRVVLVNSNPATIMTDPEFSDRTYIEPITPEAVRKVIETEYYGGAGARAAGSAGRNGKDVGASATRIDAILPTLGGQTALNCACALYDNGTLKEFGVEMIGANRQVIHRAEDRQAFKEICEGLGLKMPKAKTVTTIEEAREFLKEIGLPAIIRPAFTLGGSGGGIAYNQEEFEEIVQRGLRMSPITQVQIDQSVLGWKEYELEVVRDRKDNCVIVCGIENMDPMGVHTGDSITVAPILTLTDKEYQAMRDAAMAIMRAVGVETGGSNVQFAVNPNPKPGADGVLPFEMVVVEMNPRVSRSSALASKATGFPIAKIAAQLAVGFTLDELRNDITGTTSACFEPAIDYVVTKIPRWTFEKFREADETLTTQMKSVGEGMAIGRTLAESLQKAIRSMEVKRFGLGLDKNDKWLTALRAIGAQQLASEPWDTTAATALPVGEGQGARLNPETSGAEGVIPEIRTADGEVVEWPIPDDKLQRKLSVPSQGRLFYIRYALKLGYNVEQIHELTRIDRFFLDTIARIVAFEDELLDAAELENVTPELMWKAKQLGFSDAQLANLYLGNITPDTVLKVRESRKRLGVEPVYKLVDTCSAEFDAATPYFYSAYERPTMVNGRAMLDDEIRVSDKQKVIILGGGPNRIGQGIEFDYCCVHASFAARDLGFESVMINSNPETVSTDYDTSNLLFFEPLTLEDVLNVVERLNGGSLKSSSGRVHGLIVQFGGQTPLNLAKGLVKAGAPIIGTSVDSIDLAEDRDRFDALLVQLGLEKPPSGIARTIPQAVAIADRIGYPVLVRPSYVLGGRGMEICSDERTLTNYMNSAAIISDLDDAPVLIDRFLSDATEVDVDVLADYPPSGRDKAGHTARSVICGVMEHIEHAGIHSGDSSCTIPPWSLSPEVVQRIRAIGHSLAGALKVNGLMNVQLAIKDDRIYILEVNPRASRTVPFVSKAKHRPFANLAARVMMGRTLDELGVQDTSDSREGAVYAVKVSVFPFAKFPGVDVVLGPEMRSTGEVMGIDHQFPVAFAKGLMGGGTHLPRSGAVYLSVKESDRGHALAIARQLQGLGFQILCSGGTGGHLKQNGVECSVIPKLDAGVRPHVIDFMTDGKVQLVLNTPSRTGWQTDEGKIRSAAVKFGIPMITTVPGMQAAVKAIAALQAEDWHVAPMQEFRERLAPKRG